MSNLEANLLVNALYDLVQEICMSALESRSHLLSVIHGRHAADVHPPRSTYRTEAFYLG